MSFFTSLVVYAIISAYPLLITNMIVNQASMKKSNELRILWVEIITASIMSAGLIMILQSA